jgi:hypothetical protein
MNPILKFLNKFSYKFEKGYPDIKNEQDIKLIESLLKELNILIEVKKPFDFLSPSAQKTANDIIKHFNIEKDDIKSSTKNKIIFLSDIPRNKISLELEKLGYEKDPYISGSSQGGFRDINGTEILIKPKSSQGEKSSGKQNEVSFNNLINNKIIENNGPINVIIQGSNKVLEYFNIIESKDASSVDSKSFYKADSQLLNTSNKVIANISLKKRNAVRWESSKTRSIEGINVFKKFIEKALNEEFPNIILKPIEGKNNKYKLYQPNTDKVLSKVIITNSPIEIINDVVFGNDNPKTIVIKEDFENFSNYTFENGTLTINCYKVYTDAEDIIGTDDEPIFAFSNHINQAYGIEFRSFSKSLLYKENELKGSSEEIDFNNLK